MFQTTQQRFTPAAQCVSHARPRSRSGQRHIWPQDAITYQAMLLRITFKREHLSVMVAANCTTRVPSFLSVATFFRPAASRSAAARVVIRQRSASKMSVNPKAYPLANAEVRFHQTGRLAVGNPSRRPLTNSCACPAAVEYHHGHRPAGRKLPAAQERCQRRCVHASLHRALHLQGSFILAAQATPVQLTPRVLLCSNQNSEPRNFIHCDHGS